MADYEPVTSLVPPLIEEEESKQDSLEEGLFHPNIVMKSETNMNAILKAIKKKQIIDDP